MKILIPTSSLGIDRRLILTETRVRQKPFTQPSFAQPITSLNNSLSGWRTLLAACSGEHRLPACSSRQLAETFSFWVAHSSRVLVATSRRDEL